MTGPARAGKADVALLLAAAQLHCQPEQALLRVRLRRSLPR